VACLGEVDPLLEQVLLQGVAGCVVGNRLEVELHLIFEHRIAIVTPLPTSRENGGSQDWHEVKLHLDWEQQNASYLLCLQ